MKNSPHRHKHQVNKAVRESNRTQPNNKKSMASKDTAKITAEYNKHLRPNEHLLASDPKVCKEILSIYKKHFERWKHIGSKHSRRANPGMIEGESPFTHIRHHKDMDISKKNMPSLQKSASIARKVIKNNHQSRRKAA